MGSLDGQIVIVTGGGGNLGRAVAAAFAAEGAQMALVDLHSDRVAEVINGLPGGAGKHLAVGGDLSTPDGVLAVLNAIVARYGKIDSLVHTVGGYAAGKPVHEESLDVLDKMMNLNVRPMYLVGGAVARQLLSQGSGGSIVFILAKAGQKGSRNSAAYTASKAAATRVMEAMAAELRESNIRVNGVSPSTIDTPLNRQQMPDADPGKWVTPAQLAQACVYLCREDTGIFGANVEVFGKGG